MVGGFPRLGSGCGALLCGAADGVQYMRDTCMTLCYFLQAYPPGSQLLLQGHPTIITHLTGLHDDLIPQMAKSVTAAGQDQHPQVESLSLHSMCAHPGYFCWLMFNIGDVAATSLFLGLCM